MQDNLFWIKEIRVIEEIEKANALLIKGWRIIFIYHNDNGMSQILLGI